MLPDIDPEHDLLALHQRAVLVGTAFDHELATLLDQPRPAAPEASNSRFRHLLFERIEAAERRLDRIGNGSGGWPAGLRTHNLPEHGVVRVAAPVVTNGRADVFGYRIDTAQELLDALRLQTGMLLEGGVQIRDVCVVMLSVVNLHGLLVDVRFQRVERVRKRWKRVSHRTSSLSRRLETVELEAAIEWSASGRAQPSSSTSDRQERRCDCEPGRRRALRASTADD